MISNMLAWLVDASPVADLAMKLILLMSAVYSAHVVLRAGNPRWRVVAWRAGLAGAIVLPLCVLIAPRLEVAIAPPTHTVDSPESLSMVPLEFLVQNAERSGASADSASLGIEGPITQESENHSSVNAALLAGLLWAMPTLILLTRFGLGIRAAGRLRHDATSAPLEWTATAEQLSSLFGLKHTPQVAVSPRVATPLLCGVRRPAVLLPARMLLESDAAKRRGVLAHELAHARGNDLAWFTGFEILRALLWFVPLTWWMPRLHERACEEVADAIAADHAGGCEGYARTLAQVALAAAGASRVPATISMAARANVIDRLERLKRTAGSRALRMRSVAVACGISLLLVVVIGCTRIAQAETNGGPPAPETAAGAAPSGEPGGAPPQAGAAASTARRRFSPAEAADPFAIPQAANGFGFSSGMSNPDPFAVEHVQSFQPSPGFGGTPPLAGQPPAGFGDPFAVPQSPFGEGGSPQTYATQPFGDFHAGSGMGMRSANPFGATSDLVAAPSTTAEEIRALLKTRITMVNYEHAPLASVLKNIADSLQFNILFDPAVGRMNDQEVTVRLSGMTLEQTLDALLESRGLDWTVDERGFVRVSGSDDLKKPADSRRSVTKTSSLDAVGTRMKFGALEVRIDEVKENDAADPNDDAVKVTALLESKQQTVTIDEFRSLEIMGGAYTIVAEEVQASRAEGQGRARLRVLRNDEKLSDSRTSRQMAVPTELGLNEEREVEGLKVKLVKIDERSDATVQDDLAELEVKSETGTQAYQMIKGAAVRSSDETYFLSLQDLKPGSDGKPANASVSVFRIPPAGAGK